MVHNGNYFPFFLLLEREFSMTAKNAYKFSFSLFQMRKTKQVHTGTIPNGVGKLFAKTLTKNKKSIQYIIMYISYIFNNFSNGNWGCNIINISAINRSGREIYFKYFPKDVEGDYTSNMQFPLEVGGVY